MPVNHRQWIQFVPGDPDKIWDFFSRPENLARITPPPMNFRIRNDVQGKEMYEGMMIAYTVAPIWGIDLTWVTEITHIRPGRYFVDEQRIGPYTLWHHEHWFDVVPGGVNMRDILHYAVPFGWLGGWADRFFIASQIEDIFAYRNTAILKGVDEGWFE